MYISCENPLFTQIYSTVDFKFSKHPDDVFIVIMGRIPGAAFSISRIAGMVPSTCKSGR
jgi:hypothetical protein